MTIKPYDIDEANALLKSGADCPWHCIRAGRGPNKGDGLMFSGHVFEGTRYELTKDVMGWLCDRFGVDEVSVGDNFGHDGWTVSYKASCDSYKVQVGYDTVIFTHQLLKV